MASRRNIIIPVQILTQLYIAEHKTTTEIGDIYGVSRAAILWKLKQAGIPTRKARIQGMDETTLRKLYEDRRWSTIKIAEYLGARTDETVRKALMRYGIPIRTKSEAGKVKIFTPEHMAKLKAAAMVANRGKFGDKHPTWTGGRHVNSYGYIMLRVYEDMDAPGKYKLEHRHIMEQHLGYKLEVWEEINHINGIKTDNRLENLEVIYSEHKHKDELRRRAIKA